MVKRYLVGIFAIALGLSLLVLGCGTVVEPEATSVVTTTTTTTTTSTITTTTTTTSTTTSTIPDTTPPNITSVNPADGATGIARTGITLQATFDEDMDPATIDSTSFTVDCPLGVPVTGTVAYDLGTKTATFTPDNYLSYGVPYIVTVHSSVTDLAGNPLVADYMWIFTTADISFSSEIVEDGDGTSTSYGFYSSIALDNSDNVYIAHYDSKGLDLRFAYNDGSWNTSTLDHINNVGMHTSLAVSPAGEAHISYTYVNGADRRVRYITNTGGAWAIPTDINISPNTKFYTSIALDSSNYAHISFFEDCSGDLMYATNSIGGAWVQEIVDAGNVSEDTAIAVDQSDNVHIAYAYGLLGNKALNYITGAFGSWGGSEQVLAISGYKQCKDIALDSEGRVHISYYDKTLDQLRYATNSSGVWVDELVGVGYPGEDTSIAIDVYGGVHICFQENFTNTLMYATHAGGDWVVTTIDDVGYNQYCSLALGSDGRVHISYADSSTDDLIYVVSD
ncbi:MAG: Ig-like domain-containing protein [Candidatus Saganbacteria bacterium]|nr:Ig-like domain-containing protein [Candidatus Saganbacteria bacterium]